MCSAIPKILVTGGAGFIGSEFSRLAVSKDYPVVIIDKLSYAGDLARIATIRDKISFYKNDICDRKKVDAVFAKENPSVVVHFAAQTHVDRSIQNAADFLDTNICGTHSLLEAARKYKVERFIHISTDEVYGEIKKGRFCEDSNLAPGNPYSASKAGADLLIKSYIRTYDFPAIIVRPSNNYGIWQYPEKLIPVVILKTLEGEKVPVYGKGKNQREWLYVEDCVRGVLTVMNKGKVGQIYNLGSSYQQSNLATVEKIIKLMGRDNGLIQFVVDRPGHDWRYALDSSKIAKLGWKPKFDFKTGIKETVDWYKQNINWVNTKRKKLEGYWRKIYKKL